MNKKWKDEFKILLNFIYLDAVNRSMTFDVVRIGSILLLPRYFQIRLLTS